MANNTVIGVNALVALNNLADISTLPITAAQVAIIYQAEGVYTSWVPGRGTNTLTSLTAGVGYIIVALAALDLSAYFVPPIPSGGSIGVNAGIMAGGTISFFVGVN